MLTTFGADLTKQEEMGRELVTLGLGAAVGAGIGLFYGRTLLGGLLGLGGAYVLRRTGVLGTLGK